MKRRIFLERGGATAGLVLEFGAAGTSLWLTPAQARERGLPLRKLGATQARTLEVLAERIVPGARLAGVVAFIDQQLAADPDHAMLIAKYFQVPPPYLPFYEAGAGATDRMAHSRYGKPFAELRRADQQAVVAQMAAPGSMEGEFPIFLFYLCLRSDGVDVVYGTPAGFKGLQIPYMAHIEPPRGWNGERA